MAEHPCQTFCMILSCLGFSYLMLIGILVGTESTVIHFKPNDKVTSTAVFIVSSILYLFIFLILVYFKIQRRQETGSLQRWMGRRDKPIPQETELRHLPRD